MGIFLLAVGIFNLGWPEERSGTENHPVMGFENRFFNDTSLFYDVLHYKLILDIDIPAETLSGSTDITLQMLAASDSVALDFVGLTVSAVQEGVTTRAFSRQDSSLIVDLGRTVNPGSPITLTIVYHGQPTLASSGFGKGMYINSGDQAVTYTCNAPWGAKYWFPCQDNPADKATMDMSVTVPEGYEVISNGKLISADRIGPEWIFQWEESHPIATYLITLAASQDYALTVDTATVEGAPVPIYHWVPKADSAEITPKLMVVSDVMEYFSELFYPYPFRDEKYAHVAVPVSGAMENQTCTHINTGVDWDNWNAIVAHEFSHSWWGDATTCRLLKHMWLNEGFATYCEALWFEHSDGAEAYQEYFENSIAAPYLKQLNLHRYAILDPPWSYIYSVLTYEKPAAVLHMLRRIVGDEDFFAILQTYGTRYQDSTALSEEFESIVDEVTGSDYSWFFDQWLRSPGHPKYLFSWDAEELGDSTAITLKLRQTQTWPPDAIIFTMPVECGVVMGTDTSYVTFTDSLEYQEYSLLAGLTPDEVVFDPHGNLLCERDLSGIAERRQYFSRELACVWLSSGKLLYYFDQPGVKLNVELYDVSGRKLGSWHGIESQGILDLGNLARGAYFLRMTGPVSITRKLVLSR